MYENKQIKSHYNFAISHMWSIWSQVQDLTLSYIFSYYLLHWEFVGYILISLKKPKLLKMLKLLKNKIQIILIIS